MKPFLAGLAALVLSTHPVAADERRRLYLFAPDASDPRFLDQRERVAAATAGLAERDFSVVAQIGADAPDTLAGQTTGLRADLHRDYGVAADAFAVILVGKDGGEKARWSEPVALDEVFALVDAMPMRRREIRERSSSAAPG